MSRALTKARVQQLCQAVRQHRADITRRYGTEHGLEPGIVMAIRIECELANLLADLAGLDAMTQLHNALQAEITPAELEASAARAAQAAEQQRAYLAAAAAKGTQQPTTAAA